MVKSCNPRNPKARNVYYVCNKKTGRYVRLGGKLGRKIQPESFEKINVGKRKKIKPIIMEHEGPILMLEDIVPPPAAEPKKRRSRKKNVGKRRSNKKKKNMDVKDLQIIPYKSQSPFDHWPSDIKQGKPGINEYIMERFVQYKLFNNMDIKCTVDFELMAYQYFVYQLVRPYSEIQRLLCVHRTGAGKTLTIIMCLNNFFYDSRAKILLFPTQSVAQNFYGEIMKFPNLYRNFVIQVLGDDILEKINSDNKKSVSAARQKIADTLALKGLLSKAGSPGFPGGPLRAYRYSQKPSPNDPMYRVNFQDKKNPYDNKMVIMDEVHNLVAPSPEMVRYKNKLEYIAKNLSNCKNCYIIGFTATPFTHDIGEGEDLLKIIKGGNTESNEGYISYFNNLPKTIYPEVKPQGAIGNVVHVKLEGNNQKYYDKVQTKIKGDMDYDQLQPKDVMKLMNAANMSTYYTQSWRPKFQGLLQSDPEGEASKLYKIVKDVIEFGKKSLILIHRAHGFRALEHMFKIVAAEKNLDTGCRNKCWTALYDKDANGAALVQAFNSPDNLEGDKIMSLVVDAQNYSEGVSFFGVRALYLVNPPRTMGSYEQRIGRILRACSYEGLPVDERNTKINIYVADGTIDEWLLGKLTADRANYDSLMKQYFEDPAMDKGLYENGVIEEMRKKQYISAAARRREKWARDYMKKAGERLGFGQRLNRINMRRFSKHKYRKSRSKSKLYKRRSFKRLKHL